jgi:WD40 repeat protein/serine/threonine protein kinase
MTPDRWEQIKEIFKMALERTPEEQIALLDSACSGDPDLRSEVESLLIFHDKAEDFLVEPRIGDAVDLIVSDQQEEGHKTDPLIGRRLGEFTIREKLGEGGFGAAYKAEQPTLAREAVVKVLHARHQGRRQMTERFMREARLASKLEHPYTAHVYAFGAEPDGLLWIAMEMVRGTPLNELLERQGPLTLKRFVPLLDKICEVVHTAHEHGIIHRDLKPANIMVISRAGQLLPKLLDFGIAKLLDEGTAIKADIGKATSLVITEHERIPDTDPIAVRQTDEEVEVVDSAAVLLGIEKRTDRLPIQTIGWIGSPTYMAPEQWESAALAAARTDIYALGVLSYEAITGHPPFQGETRSALAAAHAKEPVPPLGPQFPVALDEVMAKVMAKRSEDRYQTALEFAAAFREASQQRAAIQPSEIEAEQRSPYPGLHTFTPDNTEFFFGRERETEGFLNRLHLQPLLTVLGASGAGKSSFIQAGVIPALEDGWRAITVRPGHAPLATLSARLVKESVEVQDLRVALEQNPNALGEALRAAAEHSGCGIVLVVDQFEELFTLCMDRNERGLYSEGLARAARSVEDSVRVVLTLRDDFLVRAEKLPGMRDRLSQGLQLLLTPEPEDLMRILVEPARLAGYEFEDRELPCEIVGAVADRAGALPLLAFTASRLWELRDRQFKQLRSRAYETMGGVGGALAQHAESVMQGMTAEEQRLVREAFRHLVTGEGTRSVLTRPELMQVLANNRHAEAVIERLISSRLLVASEAEGGIERIEIVHEALLEAWPRLVNWRKEDEEGARLRDQLRAAARQWEERGRAKGLLWRDDALAEYQLWRSRYAGKLTESEEAFGLASLADANLGRRRRRLAASIAISVLVATIVVLLWMNKQREDSVQEAKRQLLELYEEQGRQELLNGNALTASVYLSEVYRSGKESESLRFMLAQAMRPIDARVASMAHSNEVISAVFSPDSKRIITASGIEKTAKVWDAASGHLLSSIEADKSDLLYAAFSPDGNHIITAGSGAKIWDTASGRLLSSMEGHKGPVSSAVFSPDGKLVVTAGTDKTAKVWDAASGHLLVSLEGHKESLNFAAFSPDGRRVVTASFDKTAKVWDAASGRMLHSIEGHSAKVSSASFSPDGSRIVTSSWDNTAKVWDGESGKMLLLLEGHKTKVGWAEFSSDGNRIVTASWDNTARVWDAASGKMLDSLEGHTNYVFFASFSPDGRRIATASYDKTAMVWDATGSKQLSSMEGHKGPVSSAVFSPDGKLVFTASDDKTAKVWDAESGRLRSSMEGHKDGVYAATFSPDGKLVVTASWDDTLKIWEAASGKLLLSLENKASDKEILIKGSVAFRPDGKRLVTASNTRAARVWDAVSWKMLSVIEGDTEGINYASFSPDGRRIVTASMDKTVKVWDATSGEMLASIEGFRAIIWSVVFSSDGRRIVTASHDGTAKVWDSVSGELLTSIGVQTDIFYSAVFGPGGGYIVTGCGDGSIRVWDSANGKLLSYFGSHGDGVRSVALSPDGALMVTSSFDKTTKVWNARLETRTPTEIADIVKQRVPFRLEQGRLVPTR